MGVEMKSKILFGVLISMFIAILAACGSDTYYSGHFEDLDDNFGKSSSKITSSTSQIFNENIAFEGRFNLVSVFEPIKLEISALDENFEKTQTIEARIVRNRLEFTYKAPEIHFYRPFAQLDFTCRFRDTKDNTEMQFTIIADMNEKEYYNIDFYRTLESGYLKKLLQQKENFDIARQHTREAIHNLLDPELEHEYGISNAPYGKDTLEALAYNYSLFFTWDSPFYKNFKKLSQAVGSDKTWDEILSVSDISERLIDHYRLEESRCDKNVLENIAQDRDFSQLRYNMAIWIAQGKNDIDCNAIPQKPAIDTTKKDTTSKDPIIEKFGNCTVNRKHTKAKLGDGEYYSCNGTKWISVSAPEYHEDFGKRGEIVTYDGSYFMCNYEYSWRLLNDDEILPPVKDLLKCNDHQVVEYDNKYYRCRFEYVSLVIQDAWLEIPEDSVAQYQKNGKFCTDSTQGITEEENGSYFTCNHYSWTKLLDYEKKLYEHELAHKDECKNGTKGTAIYWNNSNYFYCNNDTRSWKSMGIQNQEHYGLGIFDGGVFISNDTLEKEIDDFTIKASQRPGWIAGLFDVINVTANINSHPYGAFFKKTRPYLSGLRGDKTIDFKNLSDQSESFDKFMEQYTHPESAYPAYIAQLTNVGEESYMDFATADKFCPKGYHIPDTTEWRTDSLNALPINASIYHDSPLYVRYNGKTYLYDIYWTKTTVNSTTQYCIENHSENNQNTSSRIIECPKDLYPGVQTLCIKDGESND